MKLSYLDIVVIASYFVALALFGVLVRRGHRFDDYSVARRTVPTFIVLTSLSATYIGPGFSLGLAAKAFNTGFFFVLFFLFFSLQTIVVGAWIAPRLRRFAKAYTLGDVMRELYGNEAQWLTGVISVGLCVGFTAVLARAGGVVLSQATGVQLPLAILIATGVAVTYTYTGGLKSVVGVESVQFGIIIIASSTVLIASALRVRSFAGIDRDALSLTINAWRSNSVLSILGLALSFLLGETLIPPYANRALAAQSENASRKGFILAGLFSIMWFAMMAVAGVIARVVVPAPGDIEGVLVALAGAVLPSGLLGLFLVALAAIVMSTQEALLNSAAVCLTRDLSSKIRARNEDSQLVIARLATLVFGVLAVWMALRAPGIIDGLLICYSLWASTVLPPLVWGVIGLPTTRWSGVLSVLLGGAVTGYCLTAKLAGRNPAIAVLAGLTGSAVGGLIGFVIARFTQNVAVSGKQLLPADSEPVSDPISYGEHHQ